jgi:Protein of unknown function (DUF3551)
MIQDGRFAMRPILFTATMITVASVLTHADAMAQNHSWCAVDSGDAGGNCSFVTYEHCLATIGGIGGCVPNVFAQSPAKRPSVQSSSVRNSLQAAKHNSAKHAGPKPASTKYVSTKAGVPKHVPIHASSKRASNKHVSTDSGPSKPVDAPLITDTSIQPASETVIPLPDPALLAPAPVFDCEFKSAGSNDAPAQPLIATGTQSEASTDAMLRMTLDYERQCYQQAETIVRDRLQQLQASVGETIKAVNKGQ